MSDDIPKISQMSSESDTYFSVDEPVCGDSDSMQMIILPTNLRIKNKKWTSLPGSVDGKHTYCIKSLSQLDMLSESISSSFHYSLDHLCWKLFINGQTRMAVGGIMMKLAEQH